MNETIQKFATFASQAYHNEGGADLVAQHKLKDDKTVEVKGHDWKTWGSRGRTFNTANKDTRQAFIDALKDEFGVKRVKDIPQRVRDLLNLSDFDLNKSDVVKSDKPLTARRIKLVTDMVAKLDSDGKRVALFRSIAKQALSEGCLEQLASLVKKGTIASPKTLVDFISRHFGGEVGMRLKSVMAGSQDNELFCNAIAEELTEAASQELIKAGVTRADLKRVGQALEQLENLNAPNGLWHQLAKAFARKLTHNAEQIAISSFDKRLEAKIAQLDGLPDDGFTGTIEKNMKTEHGRDILLRNALVGIENLQNLGPERYGKLSTLLSQLAGHVRELGSERAYLLAYALGTLVGTRAGVHTRMAREVLGTFLKQYTNLTDADLAQIPTALMKDFALVAADDALDSNRDTITRDVTSKVNSQKKENYTDADTHELMAFTDDAAEAIVKQEEAPIAQPLQAQNASAEEVQIREPVQQRPVAPDPMAAQKHNKALEDNKLVCNNLALIGKLFHREDVWTNDALGDAEAILDTLEKNADLVRSLTAKWNDPSANMSIFSLSTQFALNCLLYPKIKAAEIAISTGEGGSSTIINRINHGIIKYSDAATDEDRLAACKKIADDIDKLTGHLTKKIQEMLTKNLRVALYGEGPEGTFKGLPPGQTPETADLLKLAKERHPQPSHETKAQRQAREKAILVEYASLVSNPQAGGLGRLINEIADHYVVNLDIREKRAMLSGALLALTPETLTELMKDNSALHLHEIATRKSFDALLEYFTDISAPDKDGKLTAPQQKAAGEIASGILKNSGPVLQKLVQMLGAEKLPKCLQQAVKDCKSNLKPIPDEYVKAKLAEVARRSGGSIKAFKDFKSIGAASIAQAFECSYEDRNGNSHVVVVKMLRPDVRGRMEREIAAIEASMSHAGEDALLSLKARTTSLLAELDFTEERTNIEKCQTIYGSTSCKALHSVKLAEGCPQLPDVLIMEKAPGTTFQAYMDATTEKLNKLLEGRLTRDADGHYQFTKMDRESHEKLAKDLKNMYEDVRKRQANLQRLVQTWFSNAFFGNGRFHGDLHGGNIMVDENGELTVIDFGNAPVFADADRKNVVKLMIGAMRGDPDAILKAAHALVSDDSRRKLTTNRQALMGKLQEMFKLGGVENAEERVMAVFGELLRAGVEIPAAIYNFGEAFGRMLLLSNSMTVTLERISSALPYLREYRFEDLKNEAGEDSQTIQIIDCVKDGFLSIDKHIDNVLAKQIRQLRRDKPNISEVEIFKHLKRLEEQGEFDKLFDECRTENPVTTNVLHTLSHAISGTNVCAVLRCSDKYYEYGGLKLTEDHVAFNESENRAEKVKKVAPHFQRASREIAAKILEPYISINGNLGPLLEKLQGMLDKAYSEENLAPGPFVTQISVGMNTNTLTPESNEIFDKTSYIASAYVEACDSDDKKQKQADIAVPMALLIRDEIMPEIAKAFKIRMKQVVDSFDLSGLKPPVTMLDSVASSVKWHIPHTINLGGTQVLDLGMNLLWKAIKENTFDKPIDIRAGFNIEIKDFRAFASEEDGRIRATKDKKLESTSSMNTTSVHNAEAWRSLAETLRTDLHTNEQAFWHTTGGRKIAVILGLGEGVTMNDVEKAPPLTPEALQTVLAAHDMNKLDRTAASIGAIKRYLSPASAPEDVTHKQFIGKLNDAFNALFNASAEQTLNVNANDLATIMKSVYGKVITRMSVIGAADPKYAMTGDEPKQADVQRWMIAAIREELVANPKVNNKQIPSLADIFRDKLPVDYEQQINELGLPFNSPVRTAMLLRGLDGGQQKELREFLLGLINGKRENFRKPPSKADIESDGWIRKNLADFHVDHKNVDPESAKARQIEHARRAMVKRTDDLGYGLSSIANDSELYKSFKLSMKDGIFNTLINNVKTRIRHANYADNPQPPPDLDLEMMQVLSYWSAKDAYENPPELKPLPQKQGAPAPNEGIFAKITGFFGKKLF